jgi:ankyrin repeat protein
MSDKHFVWNRSKHMKLYTLALVVVLGMFGVSAEAQTCGVLCDERFLESASEAEVKAEITKADVNARTEDGSTALMLAARFGAAENVKVLM